MLAGMSSAPVTAHRDLKDSFTVRGGGFFDVPVATNYTEDFEIIPGDTSTYDGVCPWADDGMKFFILRNNSGSSPTIIELARYDCRRAWDPRGAVLHSSTDIYSLSSAGQVMYYCCWQDSGSVLWIADPSTTLIRQFNCSTPYDASTASANGTYNYSATPQFGGRFITGNNGTYVYCCAGNSETLVRHTLSTPYDITTAGSKQTKIVDTTPVDIDSIAGFNAAGTKVILDMTNRYRGYTMSTAWNITTLNTTPADSEPLINGAWQTARELNLSSDGTKGGFAGRSYWTTSLSTAFNSSTITPEAFDIQPHDFLNSIVGNSGLNFCGFWENGNSALFTKSSTSDLVVYADLGTAWDLMTLPTSGEQVFDCNADGNITAPIGAFFNSNGTKLFVVNSADIAEFNLSTAYTISSGVTFVDKTNCSFANGTIRFFQISPDGKKGIIYHNAIINSVTFGTAFDASTLTDDAVNLAKTSSQYTGGISVDGNRLWAGNQQWTMTVPWDLSTAVADPRNGITLPDYLQTRFLWHTPKSKWNIHQAYLGLVSRYSAGGATC